MRHDDKPWLNKEGQVAADTDLRQAATSWGPTIWEDFLKATVEVDLKEDLLDSGKIEEFDDSALETYQSMVGGDDYPLLRLFIRTLVNRLTLRERQVIHAIFWEGETQYAIAKRLGIQRSAVRNYRDHAMKKLGGMIVDKIKSVHRPGFSEEGIQALDHEPNKVVRRIVS